MIYTESPQQARIQLLGAFAATSVGLGNNVWSMRRIRNGPGEVCLLHQPVKFDPQLGRHTLPTDDALSDNTILFFRHGVAVSVKRCRRSADDPAPKRTLGTMELARKIDALLVSKFKNAEDGKGGEPTDHRVPPD